jgi:hypothetical protein
MQWISANDMLPPTQQEVLIRTRADVNIAIYNPQVKRFEMKNGSACDPTREIIYWRHLQKT